MLEKKDFLMKSRVLWGILLLAFAIPPIYGRDCESRHKHHKKYTSDYDEGTSQLKQSRAGYTYDEESHPADYRDNIDRAKRGYDSPFGPFGRQDFEDYDDSEYRDYNEPEDDYIQGSVSTHINNLPVEYEDDFEYEDDSECEDDSEYYPNYPYEEYARYSVSTDGNKIPTYVDYFPGLRGFPY